MDKLLIKELCVKIMSYEDRKQVSYSSHLKKVVTIEELATKVLKELES